MGFGMGLVSVSSLMLIQEVVQQHERGSATASNMFSRNLGSALGATLLGAVLNYGINHTGSGRSVRFEDIQHAFSSEGGGSAALDRSVDLALQHALHITFLAMFAISGIIILVAALVPPVRMSASNSARHELGILD